MYNHIVQSKSFLTEKIQTKTANIGVIGLGYVGLPLVIEAVNKGFSVVGFDNDIWKVEQLNKGESYITGLSSSVLYEARINEQFYATNQFEQIVHMDIIVICVPTPMNGDGSPNLSYIEAAVESIQLYMKRDTLIILESTTYPGTTRGLVFPKLNHYQIGEEYFLAYSPERIDPGNQQFTVSNTTKVIGGMTEKCTQIAKRFYESILQTNIHTVSSPEIAEMEKLLENTFRQVNIALINELSVSCHQMNIDVWEVVEAAATKPYGFMAFTPGPGVGGHCIPIDSRYLLWVSQQNGKHMSLIHEANRINDSMPNYVIERLQNYLYLQNKQIQQANIVIIGASYKPNTSDTRESPSLKIIQQLQNEKCHLHIIDPFVAEICDVKTVQLTKAIIEQADGVLIITDHSNIDYELINQYASLIFDTRNTNYPFTHPHYYRL